MSYDIGLLAREGRPLPAVEALDAFFRERPHYTVQESGSARYGHEHTAVWFSVDYGTHRDEEGWDPIRITASTQASHTRALELVEELEALVQTFDLLVNDPTMNGMGTGELDREALVRGCLFASRFGFAVAIAMSQLSDANVRLYDEERLTSHWRWNRERDKTAEAAGDEVFVPHVIYMADGKRTLATVTWTGTMPILLPEVDAIATIDATRGGAELVFVDAADLAGALEAFPTVDAPTRHRVVEPTTELLAAVAGAKRLGPKLVGLSPDEVLGHDYWKAIKAYYLEWSGGRKLVMDGGSKKKSKKKPKKTAAKKSTKKSIAKKSSAKKSSAKKSSPKKSSTKKSSAKKSSAKRSAAPKRKAKSKPKKRATR